ncbi:hypothetical protein DENIS_4652 [Desulfonema ishimotonii]|uniref:Dockerin domain-containing protein n=1 Tax=Desulfonema ishimotonii TaxID=45657 RepID=A0A401G359_9BACT|nr:dockerin type I repeat-containing protein [Desulfonema ishimotonii]GBC63654.1 hypothetical protein DENIS_4652 [Desulfonema ishimotonii]
MKNGKNDCRLSEYGKERRYGFCFTLLMVVFLMLPSSAPAETITLYDSTSGSLPGAQGWVFAALPLPNSVAQNFDADTGAAHLDTTTKTGDSAGYFSSIPEYELGPGMTSPARSHPDMPDNLDRAAGFVVSFEVRIDSEAHNYEHRAGFSVIVTSDDFAKAIELGFWEGEIWAQEGGTENLFTHAEGVARDTRSQMTLYALKVEGDTYELSADGTPILSGPLRDYSAFSGAPPLNYPYQTPNFIFLGDDTSSASAAIRLKSVRVTLPVTVPGDADGSRGVDLRDAILILKILAGSEISGTEIELSADVDGDGMLGIADVVYILRAIGQGTN